MSYVCYEQTIGAVKDNVTLLVRQKEPAVID